MKNCTDDLFFEHFHDLAGLIQLCLVKSEIRLFVKILLVSFTAKIAKIMPSRAYCNINPLGSLE